jgi:hypothetical protein
LDEDPTMRQFMVIFNEKPGTYANLSPQALEEFVQEAGSWMDRMAKEGRYVGGRKLTNEGGRLARREGSSYVITDGPYVETKEIVGGYVIVNAADYDEAVELAMSSPPRKYSTSISVRELDKECSSRPA